MPQIIKSPKILDIKKAHLRGDELVFCCTNAQRHYQ